MVLLRPTIPPNVLFRLLFHVIFWGLWFGLPYLHALNDERYYCIWVKLLPFSLIDIVLFVINTNWLIPKIFRKHGVGAYILSIIALVLFFLTLQYVLRNVFLPNDFPWKHRQFLSSMFAVLAMTGISTGYGLISYLAEQERAQEIARQERLRAELSFLRSQISPHFIFNILNSIVYLIRTKSQQAEPVTIKLSELMRYMLYESNDEQVPLEKEVDYLRNYVELQKIRFEDDVDILLDVEGQGGGQRIEPMLLIPFVENAFKHGVGMITRPTIEVSLRYSEEVLDFTVKNKITPDQASTKDPSSGIGLPNVQRRLELLYPNKHQLTAGPQDDGWFVAHLQIRFHQPGS